MVTVKKLKKVTAVAVIAVLATSITFMTLIGFSQVYGTNIFFDDDTNYNFKVVNETVNVTIRTDGGIDIEYWIEFHAYQYSIPVVDIGFPNHYYTFSSVTADIDGTSITDIRKSEYLMCGVEIHLGSMKVLPYSNKILHVTATNPIMVFRDDLNPLTMTSVDFSPTWFDEYICRSVDYLEVNIIFPAGFTDGNQARWHYIEPTYTQTATELMYSWNWTNANSEQYTVGVGFPISDEYTVHDSWLYGLYSPIQKPIFITIWVVITCVLFAGIYVLYRKYRKNAKQDYLKPSVKIECLGIKRGLTVPEAGVLIGIPLDRIVSLIIFGLVRKKALDIVEIKPLTFKKGNVRLTARAHEERFVEKCLIPKGDNYIIKDSALKDLMVKLVRSVDKKMSVYSRKDTKLYYTRIMNKAFDMIKNSGAKNYNEKTISQQFEWMLLDPDEKRMEHEFEGREVYVPYWYYHSHHYYRFHRPYPRYHGRMPRTPVRLSGPQFAHNIVKNMESFSNSAVKNLSTLSNSVINTLFPPSTSSWGGMSGRSSGGGGCACACACAGCACACAGGGR